MQALFNWRVVYAWGNGVEVGMENRKSERGGSCRWVLNVNAEDSTGS